MMIYHAIINAPGFLPEGQPQKFTSFEDACDFLMDELDKSAEDCDEYEAAERFAAVNYDIAKAKHDPGSRLDTGFDFLAPDGLNYGVQSEDYDDKACALAAHLGCDLDDVNESQWGEFEAEGGDYLVLTDDEADEKAHEYIEQSVWAFNASFLECHIDALDADDIDRLRGDRCEDCNDALVKLIDDFEYFVQDAINADGRGHFLSSYDGNEEEEEIDGMMYFIYRTN